MAVTYKFNVLSKIKGRDIEIADPDEMIIIIHMGTNDLDSNTNAVVNLDFIELVDHIHKTYPATKIIISGPILRPKDNLTSHKK